MAKKNSPQRKSENISNQMDKRGRHFAAISIKNFRCFKDFSIGSLERINLIGGKNNVGKTSLLEAIFLLLGTTNASLILRINTFRGMKTEGGDAAAIRETLWSHLFHNFDNQATITVSSKLGIGKPISVLLKQTSGVTVTLPMNGSPQENVSIGSSGALAQGLNLEYIDVTGTHHSLELKIDASGINVPPPPVDPLFPGIFLPARLRPSPEENAARFGQLEMTESHYDLQKALEIIEPRLKRLSTIAVRTPMLYGDVGLGRMLPLTAMGDGLAGLASLLLAITSAPGGVVLIDEIENGLHYSIFVRVWQAIADVARSYNTQVFATTHSWECIKAAHEAFQASGVYDFRYHRLQDVGDTIEAVVIDQDTLQTTIESGWEIR